MSLIDSGGCFSYVYIGLAKKKIKALIDKGLQGFTHKKVQDY